MTHNNKIFFLAMVAVFAVALTYLSLYTPIQIFDRGTQKPLTSAQFFHTDPFKASSIELSRGEQVALPHDWRSARSTDGAAVQEAWYRFSLDGLDTNPSESATQAVYISHVTHNVSVILNGIWLGASGSFDEPVSRYHNEPLLFEFAAKLLKDTDNELLIRVKAAYPNHGMLSGVYVASLADLMPLYELKYMVRVTAIEMLTFAMALLGLVVLIFFAARPQDRTYGYFSAVLFTWALHNLNLFVHDIPTSTLFWESMTMATLGWMVVLMMFFNYRFVGIPSPRVERSLLAYSVVGIGLFFLPSYDALFFYGYKIWDGFLIVFGGTTLFYLLRNFWRQPNWDIYLVMLAGVPIYVFGFHDIQVVNGRRPREEGLIIQYSAFPALLLFCWFLTRRFITSINQAEDLSRNLAHKVQQREQELKTQYEHIRDLEQQQLLSEERERIMRDMHDGVGSQLVSIVSAMGESSNQEIQDAKEKIKNSLVDLRMVIDSLDPELNNLGSMLGSLRPHFESTLRKSGVDLVWDIDLLPDGITSPQDNLHVLRIVQEAVANAIKHARPSSLTISAALRQNTFDCC